MALHRLKAGAFWSGPQSQMEDSELLSSFMADLKMYRNFFSGWWKYREDCRHPAAVALDEHVDTLPTGPHASRAAVPFRLVHVVDECLDAEVPPPVWIERNSPWPAMPYPQDLTMASRSSTVNYPRLCSTMTIPPA